MSALIFVVFFYFIYYYYYYYYLQFLPPFFQCSLPTLNLFPWKKKSYWFGTTCDMNFIFFGWTIPWSWSLKNVKSSAPHLRPQDLRLYFYSYQFNCHVCLLPQELPCNKFPTTDLSLCYSVKACHHQSRPREWLACRGPQPWLRGGGLSSSAYMQCDIVIKV